MFIEQGLMPATSMPATYSGSTTILNLNYFPIDIPKDKRSIKTSRFDASDLYPKYKVFEWTTPFPLERLCISEIGLKDFYKDGKLVRTGYSDVACITLPGVSSSILADSVLERANQKRGEGYENQKRRIAKIPKIDTNAILMSDLKDFEQVRDTHLASIFRIR
ncbi:MAG: hypothetical protein Q9226_007323 [Calogaya cf. arnoldii]